MNASGNGDAPRGDNWINAIAGRLSPTGENSFRDALRQFADQPEWCGDADLRTKITEQLRTLTNADASTLADCIPTSSRDQALEHALIAARRRHLSQHDAEDAAAENASAPKCLCLVGSDHGRSIVARMASGKPTLRGNEWPLLPGFAHAPAERFVDKIDSSTAVALVAPVDFSGVGQPLTAEWWARCRQRCDETGTQLIVDHGDTPAAGNGYFFAHEMVAGISADAVILSAGLVGDLPGGLLILSESLASHLDQTVHSSDLVGHFVSAALSTLIETDALATEADAFAIALAERIATRGCVRDLHACGHTVILELDVESQAWIDQSAAEQLHADVCSEHSVLFQPPLLMTAEQREILIDRIDAVLAGLEGTQESTEATSSAETESDPMEEPAAEVQPDEAQPDESPVDISLDADIDEAASAEDSDEELDDDEDDDDEAIEEDELDDTADEELAEEDETDDEVVGGDEDEEHETEQEETELENNELDEFESNEETEKL
ncbi:aminotransferase class III-fold pyridoxal phosphate-dependent enzyme [Rhodopirellula europaea]|uniref:Aminotransferase/acetylornithine transaminase protein n=1 Tax=Rhodopirellula europaea SH398 TaxID=1263868 RepID=M5S914_9BACT|nr:aminotransferase class III-fold pyridoxal phosphate-dependent enzyme [Rhodopirellula europaea]EMI27980.1 aminotransferase/acetylornithine transaminase protein [Rhodopirellula europaea SH398]